MKTCTRCKLEKPLEAFGPQMKIPHASSWCRSCKAEHEGEKRRARGVAVRPQTEITDTHKKCAHCQTWKSFSEFSASARGRGGLIAYCKPCHAERYRNQEKARAATSRYRAAHRERHLAQHRVRMYEYRTQKTITNDGTVTDEFIKALYATKHCNYCRKFTPRNLRTADHKIPLSKSGTHSAANLVMACWGCNCSKRDMTAEEFMEILNERTVC